MIKPYEIPAGFSEKTPAKMLFAELMVAHRANLASLERAVRAEDENAHLKQKLFGRSSEKRKPKEKAPPAPMDQVDRTLSQARDRSGGRSL
jgi:hypothetical protein